MATKAKAKRAKAAAKGLSAACRVLAGGIKKCKDDLRGDKRAIAEQERLIRQLIKQGASPKLIAQAKERLALLKDTLESDEAQLIAFQEEFAARCRS